MKKIFTIVILLIFMIFNELLVTKPANACHGFSKEKHSYAYNNNQFGVKRLPYIYDNFNTKR